MHNIIIVEQHRIILLLLFKKLSEFVVKSCEGRNKINK